MIIGNNNPNNRQNSFRYNNQSNNATNSSMSNSFENKWQRINEHNQNRSVHKNIFVKDIKDQKYANPSSSQDMHDKSLAMLHERLANGTISLEEFNRKCAQIGQQRQNMNKRNKLIK